MSVQLDAESIRLHGNCRVDDAEPLLELLQAHPGRIVDLTAAVHLHAAVIQVLLALRPRVTGPAGDLFVETWVMPVLAECN